MSYRFNNENFLAIYRSEHYGNFILKIHEIGYEDLWEWEIGCGSSVTKHLPVGVDITFPMRGTSSDRFSCTNKASILFELDPDFYPLEVHDGSLRMSTYFGFIEYDEQSVLYGLSRQFLLPSGKMGTLGIKRVERWGEIEQDDD